VNLYSAHMDPKEWDEPHSFKPDRFLNDQGQVIGKERVISFSLGMLCEIQSLVNSCLDEHDTNNNDNNYYSTDI